MCQELSERARARQRGGRMELKEFMAIMDNFSLQERREGNANWENGNLHCQFHIVLRKWNNASNVLVCENWTIFLVYAWDREEQKDSLWSSYTLHRQRRLIHKSMALSTHFHWDRSWAESVHRSHCLAHIWPLCPLPGIPICSWGPIQYRGLKERTTVFWNLTAVSSLLGHKIHEAV